MRKIHLLGFALLAVFACSAFAASAAFAEPEWLAGGKPITEAEGGLPADMEGLLEITDLKVPIIGTATIHCEGLLDGLLGPGRFDLIEAMLDVNGNNIALGVLGLLCKAVVGCENVADVEVFPDNLPWLTELVLMEGGLILDLFLPDPTNQPGHEVICLIAGLTVEDLCENGANALGMDIENMASENDVLGIFNLEEQELDKETGTCTQGGVEACHVEAEMLILLENGEALAVSNE